MLAAAIVFSGCTPDQDDAPPTIAPTPSPAITAAPQLPDLDDDPQSWNIGENGRRLLEGTLPFTPDPAWGEPYESALVDELYVLQDFIWELGEHGALVQGMGLTQEQAEYVSGGGTYDEHVAGVAQSVVIDPEQPPLVEKSDVNGVPATRIQTADDGPMLVIWVFDLGDAYYELTFYEGEDEPQAEAFLAQFEAAAATFSLP